mmetsp:Transcript_19653/g.38397  ORF Transcript_19653/g.38397 Transcript_19653/m.38397 type:complete len:122 (+) Transcript_19653:1150-1515(+)
MDVAVAKLAVSKTDLDEGGNGMVNAGQTTWLLKLDLWWSSAMLLLLRLLLLLLLLISNCLGANLRELTCSEMAEADLVAGVRRRLLRALRDLATVPRAVRFDDVLYSSQMPAFGRHGQDVA